jgi:hypothetical protein
MKRTVGIGSRLASVVSIVVVLLSISAGSWAALPSYAGSLASDTSPAGIVGTGYWITTGPSQIQWSVAQVADGSWNYDYNFAVPDGNINHLILECSLDMQLSDLSNVNGDFTGFAIGTFTPPSPSDPNLPGTIHGIDFTGVNTTAGGFHFHSTRAPVWGNFYSVDGQTHNPGINNTAWNTGFLLPAPPNPPSNGSVSGKLLVPDSTAAIPDASTIVLACFGALQLLAVRKKIFR